MILPPRVPELVDLDLLLCVERTGSLSKAAREHGVSQPAASMRIRAMERRLGLQLLERLPTGCQLTSVGRMVVQWAQEVVDAAGELATRTSDLRHDRHERLRVAASTPISDHLMPHWLVALGQQLPDVSVELQVQNSQAVIEHVSSGSCDLGFVEVPCTHSEVTQTVVGSDELAVVVAPGHLWTRRVAPVTASELKAGPLVLHEKGSGTRETLEHALGRLSEDDLHYELASTNAVKVAVEAGHGAAVLSLLTVEEELLSGRLLRIPVSDIDLTCQLRATWRSSSDLSRPAQALVTIASRHGSTQGSATNGYHCDASAQHPIRLDQRAPRRAPSSVPAGTAQHQIASA